MCSCARHITRIGLGLCNNELRTVDTRHVTQDTGHRTRENAQRLEMKPIYLPDASAGQTGDCRTANWWKSLSIPLEVSTRLREISQLTVPAK